MYRVVLYELIGLLLVAGILGFLGILPYTPVNLLFSVAYIIIVCWITNKIFAWAFEAPSNPESTYVTALILALIITLALSFGDPIFLAFAFWASALAMASKYILAIGKKHIFNPAAIAVVITALALNLGASWWIGTAAMLPFVIFGGFLITRKIHRFNLVLPSIIASFVVILGSSLMRGGNIFITGWGLLISTPLVFFATVMLTEPLTTPPTSALRVPYGIMAGILFAPFIHFGSIYSTPELALAASNIFSYIASPKKKLVLILKDIKRISTDSYDFIFTPDKQMQYRPGQYMEWTLARKWPDSRGIRRYFTLASSPTERELRLGVKFYKNGSTFKEKLLSIKKGGRIVASGLAGDFVLPKDKKKKLVFIAGGIGITPFRSMIQYMIDKNEPREVTLLYSSKIAGDIAYKDIFDGAEQMLGIKTIYAITDPNENIMQIPNIVKKVDADTIAKNIPDYKERTFYLSGPRGMVTDFEEILEDIGVKKNQIKTDYFPGFA
jgi:ferredoxin-NADP reductase